MVVYNILTGNGIYHIYYRKYEIIIKIKFKLSLKIPK